MTEHTPTPWRVEDGTDLIWGACNADDPSTYGMGYPVVEGKSASWKPYKPSREEREANAAFICKAVNNHDALVKALQLQEQAEHARVNCDECEGEDVPELCPKCFPLYDAARLARWHALHPVGTGKQP